MICKVGLYEKKDIKHGTVTVSTRIIKPKPDLKLFFTRALPSILGAFVFVIFLLAMLCIYKVQVTVFQ